MLYVARDDNNDICAIYNKPTKDAVECLPKAHPDVVRFMAGNEGKGDEAFSRFQLSLSDLSMARVIEDLVEVLIKKEVITFEDLPDEALSKIMRRQEARTGKD